MVFPGIGRAAWVGGTLGADLTGRTTAWNTYDATEDTAWQPWVDETSTAISSSYDVTTSKGSSISYNKSRCFLAIQNGTTGYIGYVRTDKADASNCQIDLVGGVEVGNINIAGLQGNIVVCTASADNGSVIAFKETADSIEASNKISDLFPFNDGSTQAIRTDGRFKQWSQTLRAPFTGSSRVYAGNFWTLGSSQFTFDGVTYLAWPARKQTNYIFLALPMDFTGTDNVRRNYIIPCVTYRCDDLNTIFSSPSSALERLSETTVNGQATLADSEDHYIDTTVDDFYRKPQQDVNSAEYTNGTRGRSMDAVIYAGSNPTYTTTPMLFNAFLLGSWTGRGGSAITGNAYLANTIYFTQSVGKTEYQDPFINDFEFVANNNLDAALNTESNGHHVLHNHSASNLRPTDSNNQIGLIRIGRSIITMFGDLVSETDSVGLPFIYGVTVVNPNIEFDTNYSTFDKVICDDRLYLGDNVNKMMLSSSALDMDSTIEAVAVSGQNAVDSTNTAYNADCIKLAALQGDYFAVVWRKSTTAYISIFEVNAQTSTLPTFERHVDSLNLGTVPEGNISVTPMGPGVALITCGNYYKFIKVPV